MEYKIERKSEFKIAGITNKNCSETTNFTNLWNDLYQKISFDQLKTLGNGIAYGCCYNELNEKTFIYTPAYDVTDEELAHKYNLDIITIPEAEYLIIKLLGKVPYCIKEGWEFAKNELFNPDKLGYKRANSPDLEVYQKGDMYSKFYEMELWIPILRD